MTPFSRYFTRRAGSVLTPRMASVMTTIDGAKMSIQRWPPRAGSGSTPKMSPTTTRTMVGSRIVRSHTPGSRKNSLASTAMIFVSIGGLLEARWRACDR